MQKSQECVLVQVSSDEISVLSKSLHDDFQVIVCQGQLSFENKNEKKNIVNKSYQLGEDNSQFIKNQSVNMSMLNLSSRIQSIQNSFIENSQSKSNFSALNEPIQSSSLFSIQMNNSNLLQNLDINQEEKQKGLELSLSLSSYKDKLSNQQSQSQNQNNDKKKLKGKKNQKSLQRGFDNYFEIQRQLQNTVNVLNIQRMISGQNTLQFAKLCLNAGQLYKNSGNYQKAINYLNKCAQIVKPNLNKESQTYINAFSWIIRSQICKGNYKEALKLCKNTQKLTKILMGEKNHYYTDILHFTGVNLSYLGNKQQALIYFNKSLEIQHQINVDQNKINETFSEVAINQCQLKRFYQATLKMNKIKAKISHNVKKNYQIISEIILHLGSICQAINNYEAALQNYQKCLKIRKKFFGSEHPKVVRVLTYIGEIYLLKKQYRKSLQILFKARDIMSKTLGESSAKNYHILMLIGQTYIQMEDHDQQSLRYLTQSQQKLKKLFDQNHPHYLSILNSFGKLYKKQKQYQKSLQYFKKLLYLSRKNNYVSDQEINSKKQIESIQLQLIKAKSQQKSYKKNQKDQQ